MSFKKFTSYEIACKDQGKDPEALPDFSKCGLTDGQIKFRMAAHKLDIINVSVNKDDDGNEWNPEPGDARYYPWMWWEKDESKPSGSGLSLLDVGYDDSGTFVASRLCCRDEKRARFMFTQHKDLFEDMIIFHK